MTNKRKDVGNRQYLAELDRIDDMSGVLLPEEAAGPVEDELITEEIELQPVAERRKSSDLQGTKLTEDFAGDDDFMLIKTGEDLMRVEQNRPRSIRRAPNEEETETIYHKRKH